MFCFGGSLDVIFICGGQWKELTQVATPDENTKPSRTDDFSLTNTDIDHFAKRLAASLIHEMVHYYFNSKIISVPRSSWQF